MFFSLPATAPAPVLSRYSRFHNDGRFRFFLFVPTLFVMAEPPEKANYDRNNHAELVPGSKTPDRSRYDTNKMYKQQRFRHAHRYEIGCNCQGAGIDVFCEFRPWVVGSGCAAMPISVLQPITIDLAV